MPRPAIQRTANRGRRARLAGPQHRDIFNTDVGNPNPAPPAAPPPEPPPGSSSDTPLGSRPGSPSPRIDKMSTTKVKAGALWGKGKEDLKKQLAELKTEIAALRTQKVTGGAASKLTKIHDIRKSIARINTVVTLNQRQALRQYYKGKKHLPLDLRAKQTRAKRRGLTEEEKAIKTEKQKKKEKHFPMRMYAIRAD